MGYVTVSYTHLDVYKRQVLLPGCLRLLKMNLASKIDHTLLRADVSEKEIKKLCAEAKEYGFAAVCIPPYFVRKCKLCLLYTSGISSCSKQTLDAPPAGGVDPNIKVNFSLDSLVARCNANNGNPLLITQNLIISGVVVGDDSSGTFYHGIDIEDSTGGIMLMIDASYLYNLYPVGTRVFVKLNGLYVVNDKGVVEIVAIINAGGTLSLIHISPVFVKLRRCYRANNRLQK